MAAGNDPLIAQKEEAAVDAGTQRRFADLFDLRRIIGGLFIVYGLILTLLGLFNASDADIERAAGVNVNLWMGLAMLAVGAFFLAWAFARPVGAELVGEDATGPAQAPSPEGVDAPALSAADRAASGGRPASSGARKAGE